MQENEQDLLPAGLLGGRLEGVELPDLMWSFCERRVTGVLEVTRRPITRKLYLQAGQIVFACSSDPNDRLGESLLRQGMISLEDLDAALRGLRSGKRLGRLLVEAGALTNEQLVDAVVQQVRSTVLDVLCWDEGVYQFHPGDLPTQELITLQVQTAQLLIQAIRNISSFRRIRNSVGPPRGSFELTSEWRSVREGVKLTENEACVLQRLERRPASVEELCGELTLSNFEIYGSVWAFRVLGLVRERERSSANVSFLARDGDLLMSSFPEILIKKSLAGETGVLYASRRNVERSFHLDHGQCVFATSSLPDDGLVSFLLRKGVISLQDREETRKRLLSNKRVGTILREMGVLDAEDLERMVRDQLIEIVYDTFLWERGEFVFVPGPLPSEELIHLEIDMPRLIAEGIRRVDSWTRVIQGCGGVDNPLSLHPDYLDVLDRMGAGPHERAVAQAVKQSRSPRRVCRELDSTDYQICQTLWILRLLGGIETARIDFSEPIPEDLPAPLHADIAAQAVGQHLTDQPKGDALEVPDTAELISRRPVEAALMPAASLEAEPQKFVPKAAATSGHHRVAHDPAGTTVQGIPEETNESGPELLELEDLEQTAHAAEPSSEQTARSDSRAVPTEARVELHPIDNEEGASRRRKSEPLDEWDEIIKKFNAMHRIVYTAVRAEIGAGAVNFVRSCCGQASAESLELLEGVELQPDGSWNSSELKNAIRDHGVEDPWGVYERLLDREFVLLAPHLGQARATELKEQIWALQRGAE